MNQKINLLNFVYFSMWILSLSLFTANPASADVTANHSPGNWTVEKLSHTYLRNNT